MKTTNYITKLIVAEPFTYKNRDGKKITLKTGRVLETVRHRITFYHPWTHHISLGHGDWVDVPVDHLMVKWFTETKTVKEIEI